MADWLATGLLAAYYAILVPLALYGVHRIRLLWLLDGPADPGHRGRLVPGLPPRAVAGELAEGALDPPPRVTVQLPVYNELAVAPRLLDAAASLRYPRNRLEIQILDDSDDETSEVLAARARDYRQRGLTVRHLQRADRTGYKAGALAAGLEKADGELVAIFDADFVPQSDFLERTVPLFADLRVGMVQAAWGHLNRRYSLLTAVQALLLDGHFQVEHAARARGGLFFNFNGTAGIWRRRAIDEAGGFEHDTLTEDLDLSYRAQLLGWRFVLCPDLLVPSELPVEIGAFRSQQHRWTHGAAQTLRKLLPRILRASIPWRVKAEAVAHLGAHLCYPLMAAFSLLLFPSMYLRFSAGPSRLLAFDLTLFAFATLSIVLFFLRSQRRHGEGLGRTLALQLPLMALGIGMSLHNARASLSGLIRRGGRFVRTPKHRIVSAKRRAPRQGKPRLFYSSSGSGGLAEAAMTVYLGAATVTAVKHGMWWSLPFLLLFLGGFGWVAASSWLEASRRARSRLAPHSPEPGRRAPGSPQADRRKEPGSRAGASSAVGRMAS